MQQEQTQVRPWALSDAPQPYVDAMLRGIIGFRFVITRIEGKWKMSQNRELNDQVGVTKGLRERAEGDDLKLADLIERNLKTTKN
jgi:transcriptional regulator